MRKMTLAKSVAVVGALVMGAGPALAGTAAEQDYRLQLDVSAQTARQPLPQYRQELKDVGVQGRVVLRATVNSDGSVSPDIATLSGHPLLADAAATAMRRWQYQSTGGALDMTVAFNFTLQRRLHLAEPGTRRAGVAAAVGAQVLEAEVAPAARAKKA